MKLEKKKDPIIERISLPVSRTLKDRYVMVSNELHKRDMTKLHDLTRAKIQALLDEIEIHLSA